MLRRLPGEQHVRPRPAASARLAAGGNVIGVQVGIDNEHAQIPPGFVRRLEIRGDVSNRIDDSRCSAASATKQIGGGDRLTMQKLAKNHVNTFPFARQTRCIQKASLTNIIQSFKQLIE